MKYFILVLVSIFSVFSHAEQTYTCATSPFNMIGLGTKEQITFTSATEASVSRSLINEAGEAYKISETELPAQVTNLTTGRFLVSGTTVRVPGTGEGYADMVGAFQFIFNLDELVLEHQLPSGQTLKVECLKH